MMGFQADWYHLIFNSISGATIEANRNPGIGPPYTTLSLPIPIIWDGTKPLLPLAPTYTTVEN